jgi:hypothetical protein
LHYADAYNTAINQMNRTLDPVIKNGGIFFLLMLLSAGFLSCKSTPINAEDPSENAVFAPQLLTFDTLSPVDNKGVEWSCAVDSTYQWGEEVILDILCTLHNRGTRDANYLNESCNGLDGYIRFLPTSYTKSGGIQCNATYPMIQKIPAGDSVQFKISVTQEKSREPLRFALLDLRLVDRYIPFELLLETPEIAHKILYAPTRSENLLIYTFD